MNVRRNTRTNN